MRDWTPGRDPRAVWHPPEGGRADDAAGHHVVVVGGGIAGLSAATGLAERGVRVTLLEREPQLGGRVAAWPVDTPDGPVTMSRGFHAFFRQYYNLRALLRRADPALSRLRAVADYPLQLKDGPEDSFAGLATRPPWNVVDFMRRSPTFSLRDLRDVDVAAATELVDVDFPATFARYDGVSAADFLDRLRFPDQARHLALEVFARSFFADPADFSAGELVAMFHTYFLGSAEGLLFDVPDDDFDTALWQPLARHLDRAGVDLRTGTSAQAVDTSGPGVVVATDDGDLAADAVVLAGDRGALQRLVAASDDMGTEPWRSRLGEQRVAPPFVVWRRWLDTTVSPSAPGFRATSGFGPLDNVSVLERLEHGAAAWTRQHGGSVVEVHAYAVSTGPSEEQALRDRLWAETTALHPELVGARTVHEEWLWRQDCPLVGTDPWQERPGVATPDPRVVLAGDGVRCDLPVALMERAATTGWLAADRLLAGWGVAGHGVWSVPVRARWRGVPALARAAALLP
ncbi:FAD-dependent oxidoreductase [Nocardioides aequoreus]|uniref:FAD-dependent oxidoreductase n=1 Tax=Nocardioides aequoreus TaxID=397278 RepID=UPI00055B9E80|nr:FAD-dependent oxidoreductase [Nocardioides aequoreus]